MSKENSTICLHVDTMLGWSIDIVVTDMYHLSCKLGINISTSFNGCKLFVPCGGDLDEILENNQIRLSAHYAKGN